ASNLLTDIDDASPEAPWSELYLVKRTGIYSLQLSIPAPWDMPMPHHMFLGLKAEAVVSDYFMDGALDRGSLKRLSGWSRRESEASAQIFLGYFHSRPYAYNFVHPLLLTDTEAGYVHRFPDQSPTWFWYARQTFPLIDELTYTLRYSGRYERLDNRAFVADLPDGGNRYFYRRLEQGYSHGLFSSLDFPLYKGFIAELPVFGLWNYLGASFFGELRRSQYEDRPGEPGTGYDYENTVAGAKVNLLFHVMRRLPFAISQALVYDFDSKHMGYRSQVEFAGVPGSYDIFSGRRRELGSGRNGRRFARAR
nr:hypothetical protein [Fibrobacterota bacterium]